MGKRGVGECELQKLSHERSESHTEVWAIPRDFNSFGELPWLKMNT